MKDKKTSSAVKKLLKMFFCIQKLFDFLGLPKNLLMPLPIKDKTMTIHFADNSIINGVKTNPYRLYRELFRQAPHNFESTTEKEII